MGLRSRGQEAVAKCDHNCVVAGDRRDSSSSICHAKRRVATGSRRGRRRTKPVQVLPRTAPLNPATFLAIRAAGAVRNKEDRPKCCATSPGYRLH